MGAEIAKCLRGPLSRRDGYIATAEGLVTWGFGHILRQAEPEEYDAKYRQWRMEDLPIVPRDWKLFVDRACEKQFAIIRALIEKADEIVHAGDPDREGQLLIDEVLDYLHNEKPVRRLLLNALDEKSVKKALGQLKDNAAFLPLKQSALARARADWLIGMNLSRAYTLAARRAGHKVTLPVGRVKTPTLALVVRRERELQNFVPVEYYLVKAQFTHENGSFSAMWKPGDLQRGLDSEGRLLDKAVAEAMVAAWDAADRAGSIVLCETARKKEPQRLPLSLSALQVLAGKRFGYEPQQVLDTAQKLYERKLTTYPRSDCEFLPENQLVDAAEILTQLGSCGDEKLAAWAAGADGSIRSRAWNDKKITAHHAIIPTRERCGAARLTELERNVYHLVAQAYIAQFYPLHVYDQTKVEVAYAGEKFAASGRIVREAGWKALYVARADAIADEAKQEEAPLPAMRKGDAARYEGAAVEQKTTKPPPRFTPATLLAGMKEIHKYVKNLEAKKKLKDVYGIGTEATRATIIQELIQRGFLKAEGKKKALSPTDVAYLLIDALPDEMTYPDATAVWEDILHSMARGEGELDEFLRRQAAFARLLCRKAKEAELPLSGAYPCPRCKRGVLQKRSGKNGDFWGCSNYPRCRESCDDVDGKPKLKAPGVLCPRCKTGQLRPLRGKNGPFWGCSEYPACTMTYDDKDGKPDLGQ